jgi:DNA-binding GntR family transcriptional regulator
MPRTDALLSLKPPAPAQPPGLRRAGVRRPSAAASAVVASPVADGVTARIVDAITSAIVERRLMPGTKLAEQKIADLFGVSRTLVRQALNQLSRDRLVTLSPARGACVAAPGADEARQVFAVREMIESTMVRQLCAVISDAQLAALREHLQAEQAAVARTDVPGRTRLLADFHTVLARMTGNEVLAELLADLLNRSSLIALMYQSSHSAQQSQQEHQGIVEAITRRDGRAAARLMAQHLASVERNLHLPPAMPPTASTDPSRMSR